MEELIDHERMQVHHRGQGDDYPARTEQVDPAPRTIPGHCRQPAGERDQGRDRKIEIRRREAGDDIHLMGRPGHPWQREQHQIGRRARGTVISACGMVITFTRL